MASFNPPRADFIYDAKVPWWGWARVISPNGPGYVILPGRNLVLVPQSNYPSGAVRGLELDPQNIEDCLQIIPNLTTNYSLPDLNNVPWTGMPSFTFFPVAAASICQWVSFSPTTIPGQTPNPLVQSGTRLDGFALQSSGLYGNLIPNDYHPGVDFFAFADTTLTNTNFPSKGASVYSIADHGLIVGIGMGQKPGDTYHTYSSGNSWGAVNVTVPSEDILTYNIIVRYGSAYVLFGHIRALSPNIYVGKQVDVREVLGTIAANGTPHVHIEVRTFGTDLNSPPAELLVRVANNSLQPNSVYKDPTGTPIVKYGNKYGILAIGTDQGGQGFRPEDISRLVSVHDIAQLFQNELTAYAQDFDSGSNTINVGGMGPQLEDTSFTLTPSSGTPVNIITMGDTCAIKYNAPRDKYPVIPVNATIRGYIWHTPVSYPSGTPVLATAESVFVTSNQPSTYPAQPITLTPSVTLTPSPTP